MIKDISPDEIMEEVLTSRVIVLFSAEWSLQSEQLIIKLKSVETALPDIYCIDIEEFNIIGEKYNVYELPTIIIFNKGEIVDRVVEIENLDDIIDVIKNA